MALGCDEPPPAEHVAKVGLILRDVVAAYERPSFAAEMGKINNTLESLQFALGVQEAAARRYGLTYEQFTTALRYAKADPQVAALLTRAKLDIVMNQKWLPKDRPTERETAKELPSD